jgi:hypothetical protein
MDIQQPVFDGREVQISDVSRCNKPLEQKALALFYHLTGGREQRR